MLSKADFQNDFQGIARGSNILLQWDPVNETDYPLMVRTRLINQTSEYGADSIEANIASKPA